MQPTKHSNNISVNEAHPANSAQILLDRITQLADFGYWQFWPTSSEFNWSDSCSELHGVKEAREFSLKDMLSTFDTISQEQLQQSIDASVLNKQAFTLVLKSPCDSAQKLKISVSYEVGSKPETDCLIAVVTSLDSLDTSPTSLTDIDTSWISPQTTEQDKTLEVQQHLQELMFRSVDDLLFIKDSQFRIVQANPAFINLYPPEKRDCVIGFTTFEEYPEEQMREFLKEDQKALDSGYSEIQETIDFPGGQQKTLLTRKIGFNDLDGARYIFGIARDITTLKKTEASLEAANLELEEFAYRVSHDLRSPLVSSVHLLARSLKAFDKQSIDEARSLVEVSHTSLSALEKLAMDILDVHKIKRAEAVLEAINLEDEINTAWLRHKPEESTVELMTFFHCPLEATTDRYGLTLVLDNLISNAVKYSHKEDSRIVIKATTTNQSIDIEIQDNGIGIPLESREKLFKMFQRFHPRHATGSGLGLYMVSQWIARSGGTLSVEHLQPGTRFLIKIPQGQKQDGRNQHDF